jgi:hypothetical protein
MPRRLIDLRGAAAPLLDIVSYARPGPKRRDRLSPAAIEYIRRTVRRAPEVMVKVLNKGQHDLTAVRRHLDYLRLREEDELEIETDHGERLSGRRAAQDLIEDWDLKLDVLRRSAALKAYPGRSAKLIHKVMFSMPPGTPPKKVLEAVRNFAREEFALKHRYAMVLHTDEPHPHVHIVIKALGEHGVRLNIRRATLRHWRQEFARHLRALGVAANATERAVRGNAQTPKLDGIYRAEERGACRRTDARVAAMANELRAGRFAPEAGKARLLETRKKVERGWRAVSKLLAARGERKLAAEVTRFVAQMPPPRTDREQIADVARQHNMRETPERERQAPLQETPKRERQAPQHGTPAREREAPRTR